MKKVRFDVLALVGSFVALLLSYTSLDTVWLIVLLIVETPEK